MEIVISQPMYLPWAGMFEQIRLCKVFVFYDDVQFSKGSFTNRVQIKSNSTEGIKWLTIPLEELKLGSKINEININQKKNWKKEHLDLLKNNYEKAPFYSEMIMIVNTLFAYNTNNLSEFTMRSMELVFNYFKMDNDLKITRSSELDIQGKKTQRVFDIVKHYNCKTYITGHGAKTYFDHELFDDNNIDVQYIDYKKNEYSQLFGTFNPFVSIIDLIANTGQEGINYLNSGTLNWRTFIEQTKYDN